MPTSRGIEAVERRSFLAGYRIIKVDLRTGLTTTAFDAAA
jgi:hypothetical protein